MLLETVVVPGNKHSVASGTARQSRDPSLWSPGSLCAPQWHWESRVLPWLSLQQLPRQPWLWLSSRTPGTSLPRAVCGVTRVPHPRLPHPALPCGVHGRALLTVEHLGEGFKVLQRAHHPKQKEGTHLLGSGCSGEKKVVWSLRTWLQFRIQDALGNTGNMSNEMPEQSGFGPAPSPMDCQIHQVRLGMCSPAVSYKLWEKIW